MRLNAAIPPDLERILNKLLEKDRNVRYQSARDLRADLERLRRDLVNASGTPPASPPNEASIVVLPLENLSPDPDNECVADGLAEEVIADLSQIRALRVISRTSAMRLKRATKDVRTIASERGVRYVLEGKSTCPKSNAALHPTPAGAP